MIRGAAIATDELLCQDCGGKNAFNFLSRYLQLSTCFFVAPSSTTCAGSPSILAESNSFSISLGWKPLPPLIMQATRGHLYLVKGCFSWRLRFHCVNACERNAVKWRVSTWTIHLLYFTCDVDLKNSRQVQVWSWFFIIPDLLTYNW